MPPSATKRPKRLHYILAIIGFAAVQIAMIGGVWKEISTGAPDFAGFYSAGRMIVEGRSADLYNMDAQWEFQRRIVTFPDRQIVLPFNHPPHEALLYIPLALTGYVPAYLIWLGCNVALLTITLYALREYIPALAAWPPRLIFAATVFAPVTTTLMHGQDSILLLMLYSFAFVSWMRKRDDLAGLFLAVASLKFQLALPFLIALVATRSWRVLRGYVAGGVGLALISALVVGWRTVLEYPRFVLNYSKLPVEIAIAYPTSMPNLRGFVHFLMGNWAPHRVVGIAVAGASLLALVWLIATMWREGSAERKPLLFAYAAAMACALSFHHYGHDQVVLGLTLLLVAQHATSIWDARRRKVIWVVIVAVVATAYLPIPQASVNFATVAALIVIVYRELKNASATGMAPAEPVTAVRSA